MRVTGFPYHARNNARLLILGSMPSEESLRQGQYYAHPRNQFWPIMGRLFGAGPELPYEARLLQLQRAGVALWDVAHRCIRPGSLDADMREVEANDFAAFFSGHPEIRAIFFNGATAETLYRRLVLPILDEPFRSLDRRRLPSTSPAHAALSFAQKLARWRSVESALRQADAGP